MSKTMALAIVLWVVPMVLPALSAGSDKAPAVVQLGAYVVDPQRTQVGFTVAQ